MTAQEIREAINFYKPREWNCVQHMNTLLFCAESALKVMEKIDLEPKHGADDYSDGYNQALKEIKDILTKE